MLSYGQGFNSGIVFDIIIDYRTLIVPDEMLDLALHPRCRCQPGHQVSVALPYSILYPTLAKLAVSMQGHELK